MTIESLFPINSSWHIDVCRSRCAEIVYSQHNRPEDCITYRLWINDAPEPEDEELPRYMLTREDAVGNSDELARFNDPRDILRRLRIDALRQAYARDSVGDLDAANELRELARAVFRALYLTTTRSNTL